MTVSTEVVNAPDSRAGLSRASGLPVAAVDNVAALQASMSAVALNDQDKGKAGRDDNSSDDDEADGARVGGEPGNKKKKKKKKKSKGASKLGGDVDLAFSSASNVKYPEYEMDVMAMIRGMRPQSGMEMHEPEGDPREYFKSIGMPGSGSTVPFRAMPASSAAGVVTSEPERLTALFPGGEDQVAFFGFGGTVDGREPWSYVIADAYTRLFFKGHPMDGEPLRTEPHVTKIPLRIVEVAGRGKALFATRAIAAGTAYLREPPLLLALGKLSALTIANFERITGPMHARCAAAYDALHNCKPYAGPLVSNRHGILRTNGFRADFGEELGDRFFSAVMQIMSRANHSCDPNTVYDWDWQKYHAVYTARRDIAAGEEITVSYLGSATQSKLERRKELKTKYLFTCTCERCGPA